MDDGIPGRVLQIMWPRLVYHISVLNRLAAGCWLLRVVLMVYFLHSSGVLLLVRSCRGSCLLFLVFEKGIYMTGDDCSIRYILV
jgi:hypothetical protein